MTSPDESGLEPEHANVKAQLLQVNAEMQSLVHGTEAWEEARGRRERLEKLLQAFEHGLAEGK